MMEKSKVSVEAIRKANQKMIDNGIVEKHYKTVHENEVFINPPKKEKLERELKWIQQTEEDIVHIHLKNLISSTPNDFELGRLIREIYGK